MAGEGTGPAEEEGGRRAIGPNLGTIRGGGDGGAAAATTQRMVGSLESFPNYP